MRADIPSYLSGDGLPFPTDAGELRAAVAGIPVGGHLQFYREGNSSTYLKCRYSRLDPAAAKTLRTTQAIQGRASSHTYEGNGLTCPCCDGSPRMTLVHQYTSSDGFCGVERGYWVCPNCDVAKFEDYEGYGSIFA